MNQLFFRLRQMFLGWGGVGAFYHLSDRFQGPGHVLEPGFLDRIIPFSPLAIWPYLSFFALIPLAYLSCPIERLRWLRSTFLLSALLAAVVFIVYPTTLAYPAFQEDSLSSGLLAALILIDSPQNCLPSLHMTLSTLAIMAMYDARRPAKAAMLVLWGLLVGFSIMQLRRHLFVDLVAGTTLGLVTGWLCQHAWARSNDLQGATK